MSHPKRMLLCSPKEASSTVFDFALKLLKPLGKSQSSLQSSYEKVNYCLIGLLVIFGLFTLRNFKCKFVLNKTL